MRWIVALVVTAAGVALGFAGLVLLRDEGPEALLPDLDQALPTELAIVQEGDTYSSRSPPPWTRGHGPACHRERPDPPRG